MGDGASFYPWSGTTNAIAVHVPQLQIYDAIGSVDLLRDFLPPVDLSRGVNMRRIEPSTTRLRNGSGLRNHEPGRGTLCIVPHYEVVRNRVGFVKRGSLIGVHL
jgi:hypothetical protein